MKTIYTSAALVVVVFVLSFSISGQMAEETDRSDLSRHSIAAGGIDSVNMTNGNASLNIPLAQLTSARGSASVGYSLRYSSKLYAKIPEEVTVDNSTFTVDFLYDSPEGGWKFVEGPVLETKDNGYKYSHIPTTHPDNYRVCSLRLVMPSGTSYEMAPWGAGRRGDEFTCFRDTQFSSLTETKIYLSVDGSFARATIDSTGTYKIFFPDGGRMVTEPGQPTYIYDRNGNWVRTATITLTDSSTVPGWQDNFGRYIAKKFIDDDEQRIYASGFNGQEIYWTIKWKNVGVKRKFTARSGGLQHGGEYEMNYCTQFQVVDEVILPTQMDSLKYEFQYYGQDEFDPTEDCSEEEDYTEGFGEVKQITMPLGSRNTFAYSINQNMSLSENYSASQIIEKSGKATTKTIKYDAEYDGNSSEVTEVWGYASGTGGGSITQPNGAVTSQEHYHALNDVARGGMPFKTTNPDGSVVEKIYAYNNPYDDTRGPDNDFNPYVKTEFTSIPNNAGTLTYTAIKDYEYDKNGNVTKVTEYDWQSYGSISRDGNGHPNAIPNVTPSRITVNTYHNDMPAASSSSTNPDGAYWNGTSQRFLGAVKSTVIRKPTSTTASDPVARTEITYDDALTTANPTETKTFDSYEGNQTRTYSEPLTSTNSISATIQYNSTTKLPEIVTDAMNVQTVYMYGCIDGQTSCASNLSNLWPTKTETANGTSVERTSSATYDLYTGKVKLAKDVDNDISVLTEYDALARPTKVRSGYNGALESWVVTTYDDAERRIIVKSDVAAMGDGKKVAIQHLDQLGRGRLSRTLENPATESPTNEEHGIKVQTRYLSTYSSPNGYTYTLTSNPYRADESGNETAATMGWTRAKAWHTGKKQEAETFTGASLPAPWGTNSASTGIVTTQIDADRTVVTDQAGKSRISRSNALGHLTDVWEILDSSVSGSVSVTFPNTSIAHGYKTSYTYDTLNNLTHVEQGDQDRYFSYSSMSRLLSAENPESGEILYEYDANGNLSEKTDARGVVTTYAYDLLNRVTERSYATPSGAPENYQATPTVSYTYDNVTNAKGKLTKVTTGPVNNPVATTEYTAFDILGRVTKSKQTMDGVTYGTGGTINDPTRDYEMTYSYNLTGALIEQQYPSGRKVQNTLDATGDLEMVKSRKNASSGYWAYANNFTYNAVGAMTSVQLGNGTWESTVFNSRLQPTQIALGVTQNGTGLLDLDYTYGTTANNGNVATQTITVPGLAYSFVQTYTYDSLNRLTNAEELKNSVQQWEQTFMYDRYGNRNFNESETTTLPKNCGSAPSFTVCTADRKVVNPAIDPESNRLDTDDIYAFDDSGNLTDDPSEKTFIYDSENKQVKVLDDEDETVGEYWYDGDGKRIKKYAPASGSFAGEATVFVYDAFGKLVAEYSVDIASTNDAKVAYLTNDHLGSPRINTDKNGNVTARHDYHPFGEEIVTSQRNSGLGYTDDSVRKQFTGYERDDETGLDYAQARMYKSAHGRYSSVDPIFVIPERFVDPQQFNLYVYTRNNPLLFIDPNGEKLVISGKLEEIKKHLQEIIGTEDAAKRVIYDEKTGVLTIDLSGIDLTKNEGANLLNDVINHKTEDGKDVVHSITIGESVETLKGSLSLKPGGDNTRTIANLDNQSDDRFPKGKPDTEKPPSGIDNQIGINSTYRDANKVSNTSLKKSLAWTETFHELAEGYSKIKNKQQYAGAHQNAADRETKLREQRPYLKEYNPGSGPGGGIVIKK